MLATLCLLPLLAALQDPVPQDPAPGEPLRADPQRLEQTVRDLVGFGTRHVLASTDDPARGTGAARDYLQGRFEELVERSGGRLRIERQSGTVAVRRRGCRRSPESAGFRSSPAAPEPACF